MSVSSESTSFLSLNDVYWALLVALCIYLWRNTYTIVDPTQKHVTEHVHVSLNGTAPFWRGKTIAQLSDLHANTWPSALNKGVLRKAMKTLRQTRPHMVLLTGDFVVKDRRGIHALEAFMEELVATVPLVYAVTGNHDAYDDLEFVERHLKQFGVAVLRNESVLLEQESLLLVGAGDLGTRRIDANLARQSMDRVLAQHPHIDSQQLLRITLSHNPDSFEMLRSAGVALQLTLSGHTHGGQICLPVVGAVPPWYGKIVERMPLPRAIKRLLPRPHRVITKWKRASGLFRFDPKGAVAEARSRGMTLDRDAKYLYVNRGLGTHPPGRLFCHPEVTLFHFN